MSPKKGPFSIRKIVFQPGCFRGHVIFGGEVSRLVNSTAALLETWKNPVASFEGHSSSQFTLFVMVGSFSFQGV